LVLKKKYCLGLVVYACNPTTWEAEGGGQRYQSHNQETLARLEWLMPEILATQEIEIRKIMVQNQHLANTS
jgi:hypothetical protein